MTWNQFMWVIIYSLLISFIAVFLILLASWIYTTFGNYGLMFIIVFIASFCGLIGEIDYI